MQAFYNPAPSGFKPDYKELFTPINLLMAAVGSAGVSLGLRFFDSKHESSSGARKPDYMKIFVATVILIVSMVANSVVFYNFIYAGRNRQYVPLSQADLIVYSLLALLGFAGVSYLNCCRHIVKNDHWKILHVFFFVVGALGSFGFAYGLHGIIGGARLFSQ